MSDRGTVGGLTLNFGPTSTAAVQVGTGVSTSSPMRMPRDEFTVQLNAITTGTSIVGASVVWQGSNDGVGWVPLGSATALSTNASTSSSLNAAGVALIAKYAVGRGIVTATGTGLAQVWLGY